MRSIPIPMLLAFTLAVPLEAQQPKPAGPQNSDVSFLASLSLGSSQVIGLTGATVKISSDWSIQSSFAHTIHSFSFADLWLEFPNTSESRSGSNLGQGVFQISHNALFETPGLRLGFSPARRVTLFLAGGGGFARFDVEEEDVGPVVRSYRNSNYHGAFDFGCGIDFRLTRLLSVRGELRDFVTGRELGGVSGRNHPIADFGMSLHF